MLVGFSMRYYNVSLVKRDVGILVEARSPRPQGLGNLEETPQQKHPYETSIYVYNLLYIKLTLSGFTHSALKSP